MNVISLIFFINVFFLSTALIFQSILIPLVLSTLLFITLSYFVVNGKIKLTSTRFNIKNFLIYGSLHDYVTAVICLVIFLVAEPVLGFNGAFFTVFFIFSHLNNLNSSSAFFMSLVFLGITTLLSLFLHAKAAEITAITAYYFLIVGTIWYIVETKKISNNRLFVRVVIYSLIIMTACVASYFVNQHYSPLINSLINPPLKSPLPLNYPLTPTP